MLFVFTKCENFAKHFFSQINTQHPFVNVANFLFLMISIISSSAESTKCHQPSCYWTALVRQTKRGKTFSSSHSTLPVRARALVYWKFD
jgi:hypothetical protein